MSIANSVCNILMNPELRNLTNASRQDLIPAITVELIELVSKYDKNICAKTEIKQATEMYYQYLSDVERININ